MLRPNHEPDRQTARRAMLLAACACLAGPLLARPAPAPGADPPLFRLQPNPPSAGKDVEVLYLGNHNEDVVFQVGKDGETHDVKIGADQTFTIPKELLKAGARLYLRDTGVGGDAGNLCVLIEP